MPTPEESWRLTEAARARRRAEHPPPRPATSPSPGRPDRSSRPADPRWRARPDPAVARPSATQHQLNWAAWHGTHHAQRCEDDFMPIPVRVPAFGQSDAALLNHLEGLTHGIHQ